MRTQCAWCSAPSAVRQGGALGSPVGTRLAGSARNLEMGIFLIVDDLYTWAEAGLRELPVTAQAVRGKVRERPVVVRWCRAKEDAAQQLCGQEHVTRVDVPACSLSLAVLGVELDSFEVSK